VALVRTDVSEELNASFTRVTRIGELETTLSSSEASVLTRATRRNIPEDTILHSHRRENLKSYIGFTVFIDCTCIVVVVSNSPLTMCDFIPSVLVVRGLLFFVMCLHVVPPPTSRTHLQLKQIIIMSRTEGSVTNKTWIGIGYWICSLRLQATTNYNDLEQFFPTVLAVHLRAHLGPIGPTLLPGPPKRLGWLGSATTTRTALL
jgi:hypothetical protein